MIVHQNVFHPKPRIFIETVTGCKNSNCTSPCDALEMPISMMPFEVCDGLVSYFKNLGIEVYLYGRGDCSSYPYERLSTDLSGCVLNLTADYLEEISRLKAMGIKVFLRCDRVDDLSDNYWLESDGVFMVVGSSDKYIDAAKKILEKEKPLMLRSVCNKPSNPPIPVEVILASFKDIGYQPNDVYISELPESGCNVTTIRYKNGLRMACCILHDREYRANSLDDVVKMLWRKYDNPGWKDCDWCSRNAVPRGNYRLYFN